MASKSKYEVAADVILTAGLALAMYFVVKVIKSGGSWWYAAMVAVLTVGLAFFFAVIAENQE